MLIEIHVCLIRKNNLASLIGTLDGFANLAGVSNVISIVNDGDVPISLCRSVINRLASIECPVTAVIGYDCIIGVMLAEPIARKIP
ncbi:hypothetical protein BST46_19320 [Mycobacterium timonense]|uniref:AsnC family transcriptional regulator n=1 Tax=Mycobacterium timonense TaxID=701043 RepID=A0ABX3THY0_9MYCO|nr:hypothetical protein BST46_19320 [Mycobacterium timonense]